MATEKKPELGSVLVIGGCGFVGHHIVKQLLFNYSCTVAVLDIRTIHNRQPEVTYHEGDLNSPEFVKSVLEQGKTNVIIHTASPPATLDSTSGSVKRAAEKLFYKVNVEGTKNLLECAVDSGTVKAFVFTSSASVIHDNVSDLINADERFPVLHFPVQKNYYSETKALAEEAVLAYNRQRPPSASSSQPQSTDMLTCAIRPASVFGEGDMQMLPNMLKAYEKGQTKFQLGENQNLFDFTYVGNVAHGHILAAIALLATGRMSTIPLDHERVDGEAFFITNASPVYFWDFARMVWSAAGDKTEPRQVWVINTDLGLLLGWIIEWIFWIVTLGGTPNLTRQKVKYSSMARYYNVEKAVRRLGYEPLWELDEAVPRSVKWFQEKKVKESEKKAQ